MHFFEFHDQPWTPAWLRATLLEVLELCNQRFRPYYQWVCLEVLNCARREGMRHIVELGAGNAPLTRRLAQDPARGNLHLIACDLYPDVEGYQALETQFPGQVTALTRAVDFSQPQVWDQGTLLVLSAAFHHIPPPARRQVLATLTASADRVMIFEPIQKNPLSLLLAGTSVFPALLLPFFHIGRSGWLRQIFGCWLVPLVPPMFLWDGIIGCLRQWSPDQWRRELARIVKPPRKPVILDGIHSLIAAW